MRFDGVLFDMDGLMIDSENYSRGLTESIFAELGMPYSDEMYYKTIGISPADCSRILLGYLGNDPEKLAYLNKRYEYLLNEAFLNGWVPLKKGAVRLIEYLTAQGVPFVLATSSPIERVKNVFGKTEFGRNPFEKIVTSADVVNGKPAPDIFIRAAEMIGQDIHHCLVLEDSYNGVRAGQAAGAYTIMIPDVLPANDEMRSLAKDVMNDLDEVVEFLRK